MGGIASRNSCDGTWTPSLDLRANTEQDELKAEIAGETMNGPDRDALAAAVARAEERFGRIDGVIHAAGVPGGGLLTLEDDAALDRVLAPKVAGTLLLAELLAGRDLDFVALCSSITAVAGGFGQSAYAAANAFLDAHARAAGRRGPYVVALGWDRWEEVGMAAQSDLPLGLSGAGAAPGGHPLLDRRLAETPAREVYWSLLSPERHWVLSEHWIAGRPTLPGTTYLEMARAAFARRAAGRAVVIEDVAFLHPLAIAQGEEREVLTVLERSGDSGETCSFQVMSRRPGSGEAFRLHAQGTIAAIESPADAAPETIADEPGREITAAEVDRQRGEFLVTGRRWESLRRLVVGEGTLTARLALPEEAAGDVGHGYGLHPAMLDIAAGSVQFLADGNFLPLSYDRIEVLGPIPGEAVAVLAVTSPTDGERETITTDVTVYTPEGEPRVRVRGFSMRRITGEAAARLEAADGAAGAFEATETGGAAGEGIRPAEGVAAFRRALAYGRRPHLVISPWNVRRVVRETRALDRDAVAERLSGLAAPAEVHERPASAGEYAPPTNEVEGKIAAVWQRVLGIDRVGVTDNFFELGGTSLSGVQLVSELKRELGRDIPTVSIFEAPTVAALARYLQPKDDGKKAFEDVKSRADKKAAALAARQRARRPTAGRRGR